MTATEHLERVKEQMCDGYCKYCHMDPPEGETEDWLFESENSPCMSCPLNEL